MSISAFINNLNNSEKRDKLCKVFQYYSKIHQGYYQYKNNKKLSEKYQIITNKFATTRHLFRLFKSLYEV